MPASAENRDHADIILTAEEVVAGKIRGSACVVIDVLRASTTIVTALANGSPGVVPVETPEEALRIAATRGACILGGERNGLKIDGFHLDNSPLEYTADNIFGRFIIFTTTNGTRAIRACAGADTLFIASFLNAQAVVNVLEEAEKHIVIVCAGTKGEPSIEDTACAGMLLDMLQKELSSAAKDAVALWRSHQHNLVNMMKNASSHGKSLVELGFERDIEYAANINIFDVVPVRKEGLIVRKAS
jgi:2-phosphosulfolactate phosphatase